ncbi:NADH-quinone oxidoreductase subunit C [Porphyrobacter sp. CACIAM 03H1]|uniref:NADH-quinone oxidoreductase subunit C n=1 Tax=Porphyrobacter sp. CACIAM 03H1 TaxID=2003315 RepID=UPI000B5A7DFA|nr:NADH-quinone oxidoreductase subunit C [Porphyrobacter sp. CACIAM 03H1]ASJ91409.1 NADH-quinone oxidoreductase subunit C [Porphyrobacter sp. CACIAM 03H1]
MAVLHSAPKFASNEGVIDAISETISVWLVDAHEAHGEVIFRIQRDAVEKVLRILRDDHAYQQLMEIAGADYPSREERFEVVYMLQSLTKNHRIMVKCSASEDTPVPTVTTLWPNAGWLEREVFDMFGVTFAGNPDLRRILTDYGFEGHPFRKDFPMTGYTELRYSEEEKRVVYEPVVLPQEMRTFDFLSPWEGADYVLPGDEKSRGTPPVAEPKTTDRPAQTGAGKDADKAAATRVSPPGPEQKDTGKPAPGAPDPTSKEGGR